MITKTKKIPYFEDHSKILSKIIINGDCWNYNHRLSMQGYGIISINNSPYKAHRVFWDIFKKEALVSGMVLDHVCRNRACVNPDHLRQVSQSININENTSNYSKNINWGGFCKHGHKLTDINVRYFANGSGKKVRRCLDCKRERELKNPSKAIGDL